MTDRTKEFSLVAVPKAYEDAAAKPFPDFRSMFTNIEHGIQEIKWSKNANLISVDYGHRNWNRATLALLWDDRLPKVEGLRTATSDSWALVSVWLDYRMVEVYVRPKIYDADGLGITFLWKDTGTFPGDVYKDEASASV